MQDLALQGHDLQLEDVVNRQAVFQAVNAPGILRHIAPDGAGELRRGVWGIEEAQMGHGFRDGQVAHTGLDPRATAIGIYGQDAVELGQAEQDTAGIGQGPAGQSGPGPTGHHRHAELVAVAQDGLNLSHGFRQDHDRGHGAIGRQTVAFEGPHALDGGDQIARLHQGRQGRHQTCRVHGAEGRVEPWIELIKHGQTWSAPRPGVNLSGHHIPPRVSRLDWLES